VLTHPSIHAGRLQLLVWSGPQALACAHAGGALVVVVVRAGQVSLSLLSPSDQLLWGRSVTAVAAGCALLQDDGRGHAAAAAHTCACTLARV
jgi:hypothetical protein